MSLVDRLRRIESQNVSQQREINLLRTQMDKLLEVLAEEPDEEEVDVTSLDGVRFVGTSARDQSEPL